MWLAMVSPAPAQQEFESDEVFPEHSSFAFIGQFVQPDWESGLRFRGPGLIDFEHMPAPRSGLVLKTNPNPSPYVGPNLIISNPQVYNKTNRSYPLGLVGRSETAMATSPDGGTILVAWNDPDGFLSANASNGVTGFAYSTDSGHTFVPGGPLPSGMVEGVQVVPRGDPWLDVGGLGSDTFFISNLAATAGTLGNFGIMVHRGRIVNGAIVWDSPAIIRPQYDIDFLDKEAIAVDRRNGAQRVYLTVTRFFSMVGQPTQIELYRSFDAGTTWIGPSVVMPTDKFGQQGSVPIVGPDGEVYVFWERGRFTDSTQVLCRVSWDQGETFGPIQIVANQTSIAPFPPSGYNRTRHNDFPRVAIDYSQNHRGRIFVVYHDGSGRFLHRDGLLVGTNPTDIEETGGVKDGDIYLTYSDDHGATWSSPKLLSSAVKGDGINQFWPVISVSPSGSIDVFYYEEIEFQPMPSDSLATDMSVGGGVRRRSMYQSLVDLYWVRSRDGGATFDQPLRVNEFTSNWSISESNIIPNFGDYIASAGVEGGAYVTWAQTSIYDIDPGPEVNRQFVPSIAFAVVSDAEQRVRRRVATKYSLEQNFPNPFNASTTVGFTIPKPGFISLKVFNTLGQQVALVVDGFRNAGFYSEVFEAKDLASGVYIYKLVTEEYVLMEKMMLLR